MATHKIILGKVARTDGKGEVQLQIIHERKHREIDIGFRVAPEFFHAGKVLKSHPVANKMNEKISAAINAADTVIVTYAGEYMDIDRLKQHIIIQMKYQGKSPLIKDYGEIFLKKYEDKGQHASGKIYHFGLMQFDKFTGGKLLIHQIDESWLHKFKRKLENEGKQPNTIQGYLSGIKKVWKCAVADGLISKMKDSPFASDMFPGWRKGTQDAHEIETIKALIDGLPKLTGRQRVAIESRLVQYFTQGIDIIDLARLRKSNIKKGRIVLPYRHKNRRKKSNDPYILHIHEATLKIINQYDCASDLKHLLQQQH